eukprot:6374419-Amphidinium_carterae.1
MRLKRQALPSSSPYGKIIEVVNLALRGPHLSVCCRDSGESGQPPHAVAKKSNKYLLSGYDLDTQVVGSVVPHVFKTGTNYTFLQLELLPAECTPVNVCIWKIVVLTQYSHAVWISLRRLPSLKEAGPDLQHRPPRRFCLSMAFSQPKLGHGPAYLVGSRVSQENLTFPTCTSVGRSKRLCCCAMFPHFSTQ